jgi:hypothetical protein
VLLSVPTPPAQGAIVSRDSAYRRAACGLLAAAMLFAPIIVSAHACAYAVAKPMIARESIAAAPAVEAVKASRDCESMADMSTPMSAQCTEHCQYGRQVDQTSTVTVPAAVLTILYPVPTPRAPCTPAPAIDAAIAPSPPHAIVHCCLLI